MDPDQWFRLWLAIMQTVGGGLVTLAGGYFGYRLAGRGERDKLKVEKLQWVNDRLRSLSSAVGDAPDTVPGHLVAEMALEGWFKILEHDPPPKFSPANVVMVELGVRLMDLSVEEAMAHAEEGRPTPVPAIVKAIRGARADCSRWIAEGPPGWIRLRRRHRAATKARDALQARGDAEVSARQAERDKPKP